MLAARKTYPYTCKHEDVFAAYLRERENLFFFRCTGFWYISELY